MKYLNIIIISLLFLGLFSCEQTNVTIKKETQTLTIQKDTVMLTCNTNLIKDIVKKDNTRKHNKYGKWVYLRSNRYTVYQNLKTKKYIAVTGKHKVLLHDLNYFAEIGGGIQVLNNKNEIEYYTLDLKKLSNKSEISKYQLRYCGNVPCWKLEIIETEKYFIVRKKEGDAGNCQYGPWKIIDSIPEKGIEDIHFVYNGRTLSYDDNVRASETIIIKYHDYYAVRANKNNYYFENIDTSNNIKVKCHNHYGYFGISEVKYKELGVFEYNLCPITLDNGQKGFIDYQGNEYLSKKE